MGVEGQRGRAGESISASQCVDDVLTLKIGMLALRASMMLRQGGAMSSHAEG